MHGTLHQVGAMDPEIRWLQADRCSHVSSDTMNGSIMTLQLRPDQVRQGESVVNFPTKNKLGLRIGPRGFTLGGGD